MGFTFRGNKVNKMSNEGFFSGGGVVKGTVVQMSEQIIE